MSLRVALLTYRGNPYSGGQGVYVRQLARNLHDLGHDVTVVAGPPYPDLDAGIPLVRLPSLDVYSTVPPGKDAWRRIRGPLDVYEYGAATLGFFPEPLTFGARAYRFLQRHRDRFDVVHDNQSLSYGLLGMRRLGLPVLATVHHPIHIDRDLALAAADSWAARLNLWRWYDFLRMQGFVARRLPTLLAVSESARREASRAFRVPVDRLRVVYNGIDTECFVAPKGVRRHRNRVVVVTSSDQPIKGLSGLWDVLARVAARRDVEVVVVGRPRDATQTRAELRTRGLEGCVRFLGVLDQDQLVQTYASAAVAVVPSLYEGFGLPAAEAMACGVPVVAWDAGALPEVLGRGGECGTLVPAYDAAAMAHAVVELLDDYDRALEMGLAGRRRAVRCFNWERAARETSALYEEAIEAQTATRRGATPC